MTDVQIAAEGGNVTLVAARRSTTSTAIACLSILGVSALALVIYANVFELRPLAGDNLFAFDWAHRLQASGLLRVEPAVYPEWRPLAYLTIWLQYRAVGLDGVPTFFAVNLLLWVVCAGLIYGIVQRITTSYAGALLAAAIVTVDARAVWSVVWIVDRQSSLACLFGLLALTIGCDADDRPLSRAGSAGVAICLLASALSKEFGLAFAIALAVSAWRSRRPVAIAAITAMVAYICMRFAVAGGASSQFCEDVGFFFSHRTLCVPPLNVATITQLLYNIGSMTAGSLVPGVFDGTGAIAVAPARLPASMAWLALAAVGYAKGGRTARVLAVIVVGNSLLSLLLYRDRNQLVSLCAMAIAAGLGFAELMRVVKSPRRAVIGVSIVCAVALLGVQTIQTRRTVRSIVSQELQGEPCSGMNASPPIASAFIALVKNHYEMFDPGCVTSR